MHSESLFYAPYCAGSQPVSVPLGGQPPAFDTLIAAKKLTAADFEQTEAEAVARVIRAGQPNFPTKDDIAALHGTGRDQVSARFGGGAEHRDPGAVALDLVRANWAGEE